MTIETIKGVVGIKISMFDLIRLFLKQDPKGKIISYIRKTCTGGKKTLEQLLETSPEELESDEWSDIVCDIGYSNLLSEGNSLYISHEQTCFWLKTYRLSHDRDENCDFILGEEIMEINTYNTHFSSLARGDDETEDRINKRLDLVQIMMISFMKSTTSLDDIIKRKQEIDKEFPELKDKDIDYYLVQNDCDCCS